MNRYLSSERWRKMKAGRYLSRNGRYAAQKVGAKWELRTWKKYGDGVYADTCISTFLTLADLQEHADRLEANRLYGPERP